MDINSLMEEGIENGDMFTTSIDSAIGSIENLK